MADTQSLQSTELAFAQAINNAAQTLSYVNGMASSANLTGNASVLFQGACRLTGVSVTTIGNATGTIYDSNNVGCLTRPVLVIANQTGFVPVGIPMNYGIVCHPGSGNMALTVVYSPQLPQSNV